MPTGVYERHRIDPAERFWSHVDKTADCWLWTGARRRGYGVFGIEHRRTVYAHRFAYELLVRVVPVGFELDHLCRNPACVLPLHLDLVTHKENCLRGQSPLAINARKTHCPRGHAYTSDNVYIKDNGGRACRICTLTRNNRRRHASQPQ